MKLQYMRRAIELARQGTAGPFGCVIVKEGAIVAEGNARVFETKDPTAHGEIVAIRAAAEQGASSREPTASSVSATDSGTLVELLLLLRSLAGPQRSAVAQKEVERRGLSSWR